MGKRFEQTFHQKYDISHGTQENMLSIILGRIQIKVIIACHLLPTRLALVKKTKTIYWRECVRTDILIRCRRKCRMVQCLCKTVRHFLNNLNVNLPHNPGIPLSGI